MNTKTTFKGKLHQSYLILRYASVDPLYIYATLTDLGWGLNTLMGGKYQPYIPEFDFINSVPFSILLMLAGIVGIWNFFYRKTWVMAAHSLFNSLFYLYITTIFLQIGDGAWVRNGTMTLCITWIIWRVQRGGWERPWVDLQYPGSRLA